MTITFGRAIREALEDEMELDSRVVLMGLGVADARGVFGTTVGLQHKFGRERVFDIPLSENALTGVALGMAMMGLRPVFTHQRADFSFTSAEQLINQVAKTIYTTRGEYLVPLVIRMVVGRGWGQGPTHAQVPHGLYASIPGLRVIAPSSPADAYSMLRAAINDPNPVVFFEHRWLHDQVGELGKELSDAPGLYKSAIIKSGKDLSLAGISYGFVEAARLTSLFSSFGIDVELIDVRTISPLDLATLTHSADKTKRFALVDISAPDFSVGSEISRKVAEATWARMSRPPLCIGPRHAPVPSAPSLALEHYPKLEQMAISLNDYFDLRIEPSKLLSRCLEMHQPGSKWRDQPDVGQIGPF